MLDGCCPFTHPVFKCVIRTIISLICKYWTYEVLRKTEPMYDFDLDIWTPGVWCSFTHPVFKCVIRIIISQIFKYWMYEVLRKTIIWSRTIMCMSPILVKTLYIGVLICHPDVQLFHWNCWHHHSININNFCYCCTHYNNCFTSRLLGWLVRTRVFNREDSAYTGYILVPYSSGINYLFLIRLIIKNRQAQLKNNFYSPVPSNGDF